MAKFVHFIRRKSLLFSHPLLITPLEEVKQGARKGALMREETLAQLPIEPMRLVALTPRRGKDYAQRVQESMSGLAFVASEGAGADGRRSYGAPARPDCVRRGWGWIGGQGTRYQPPPDVGGYNRHNVPFFGGTQESRSSGCFLQRVESLNRGSLASRVRR